MFFFYFNEPRQINDIKIETLSQFIELLGQNSTLFSEARDSFLDLPDENMNKSDISYTEYIYQNEKTNKRGFANELRRLFKRKDKESSALRYRVFYRGISNSSYLPIPSIYRGNNFQYENTFINEIRISNPDFVSGKTYIDELSALQHYGCPTRLLDLTTNPLVALYFACEGEDEIDGSVLFFFV